MGNVVALREDGKDLDTNRLEARCCFVRRKLMPMMWLARDDDFATTSRQSILDSITWENVDLCVQEAIREEGDAPAPADDDL
jgi:hypothetical protein